MNSDNNKSTTTSTKKSNASKAKTSTTRTAKEEKKIDENLMNFENELAAPEKDALKKKVTPKKQLEKTEKMLEVVEDISEELAILTSIPSENESNELANNQDINEVQEEEKNKKEDESSKKHITRYYDVSILEGLTSEIVEKRKADGLINDSDGDKGKTILGIIFSNFFTFFNMLYLTITVIFVVLGSYDNLLFLATIIPNLLIGIYQEIKAKITIDKLALMTSPTVTVIRDGKKIDIPTNEVVLDDVLFFTAGKQICADSIVLDGYAEVNESLLTGEADAVNKVAGSELYSGSFVVSGVVVARVDKVGKDNYIENLSKNAKMYQKPKSELLRTLNWIIKGISFIILPLAILTYITSTSDSTRDFLGILNREGLIKSASSVLAMIPAGLFLLTSIALFVSVRRLAKSKTLVQELYCIEMLARVDVLCLDKTGTITDGSMRVSDCIEIKNHTQFTIREIVGSMMNSFSDTNPTSDALIKYFDKNTILEATEKIPFSSKRKYSAVTFGTHGTFFLGAPEFILVDNLDKVDAKVARLAKDGFRVLVLGHTNNKVKSDDLPKNIKPICIIALQDHIRDDAIDTIDYFKQNGVDVKVISGDNPITVSEIARRAGIEGADRYISLAGLSDDEVRESVFEYSVFGRVSPEQKRILVKALKDHKKIVAMTGDGVNDILALKEADCSIAMASGSEAARYVSHLVLMDSNFSSMPKVVKEGRRVINNIQKTSTMFLVKTLFAILLTIMYIILGLQNGPIKMSYPFNAKNLYMIEWFAIGIPTFFLALQVNHDIVKGKFLVNVVKSTIPGALTIVILHLLLNIVRIIPGFEQFHQNQEVFTTVATVVTTTVMMIILYKMSTPFNITRRIVYTLMVIMCLVAGFGLLSFMNLDLSYRRKVDEYNISTKVNGEYWVLEEVPTVARAYKKPTIINLSEDQYVMPVIGINKDDNWTLNGFKTDVPASRDHLELEVKGKYWFINGIATKAKAVKQPTIRFVTSSYYEPEITIDKGFWVLDGVSTRIVASSVSVLSLNVNYLGYWTINGEATPVKAAEKVTNYEEYIPPLITITSYNDKRYFVINGKRTTVEAENAESINLEVSNGYWYINYIPTPEPAIKIGDSNADTNSDYVKPTLEISRLGLWVINGHETTVYVEDNLLITEIMITIVFIQLIVPLMGVISLTLRKFNLSTEQK